jgi:hypothetical protein
MRQVGRTLTAADDDVLRPAVLICDRDRKWSLSVRGLLEEAGIRIVRTPVRAPAACSTTTIGQRDHSSD